MDEWLSDRERGGFYASQDADYSMDDDGDYFTWTRAEMQAVLTEAEAAVAGLHYDVNEVGEMHHNPEKNVLYVRAPVGEIAKRMGLTRGAQSGSCWNRRGRKCMPRGCKRPTPYVDKTVYMGWNSLCVSAYLEAAKVLQLDAARHFALRSLDRILAEAWQPEQGLQHVLLTLTQPPSSASFPACSTTTLSPRSPVSMPTKPQPTSATSTSRSASRTRWSTACSIPCPADSSTHASPAMERKSRMGVLGTRRKPFQDSPTPAGNSVAAIALLRLHAYTSQPGYREKAEQTLEVAGWTRRQVWNLRRYLRHSRRAFLPAPYADRHHW